MSKDLEAPGTLRIGSVFHRRFRIVRCIKTGGMGAVYEVVHLDTQRPRALKVLLAGALESDESRARFEREATIAAGIRSNHIVEVLDAGVDAETQAPFIVMELLVGEDLGSAIARRPLPPSEVVEYLRQAARGLEKTHAAGIVHRDLKPENLFLTRRDDGSPEIKVLDFGIAKVTSGAASAPATRGIVGTPLYIAPEQVTGDREIGPRTDVYALGHVAYALLTGQAFFQKENAALVDLFPLLMAVVKGAPEPPSERARRDSGVSLPAAFDAWFLRATAREPADRFASVTEAVTALERALVSAGGAAANVARTAPDLDRMRSEAPAPKPTEPVAHAASSARTIDDPSFKMSPAARSIDAQIVAASPAPVRAASRARWFAIGAGALAVVAASVTVGILVGARGAATPSTSSGAAVAEIRSTQPMTPLSAPSPSAAPSVAPPAPPASSSAPADLDPTRARQNLEAKGWRLDGCQDIPPLSGHTGVSCVGIKGAWSVAINLSGQTHEPNVWCGLVMAGPGASACTVKGGVLLALIAPPGTPQSKVDEVVRDAFGDP